MDVDEDVNNSTGSGYGLMVPQVKDAGGKGRHTGSGRGLPPLWRLLPSGVAPHCSVRPALDLAPDNAPDVLEPSLCRAQGGRPGTLMG